MHTQTIFELSQEVERLLQLTLQNLNTLKITPLALQNERDISLTSHEPAAQPLKFSAAGIDAQIAMLKNELRKVTQHEMVLAIVGTMKAGKSTTINAIIGTEVLPNRNRPMTALPTLIRHTPGQHEPILHFPHVLPIEALMGELQEKLLATDRQNLAQKLEVDRDMDALLDRIIEGTHFENQYLGARPIFHCLKSLNDLVRLAAALEVPFPFKSYAAIEHVPFIEVEFAHLAGLDRGQGQLTLLDTPGPNEAGQPHLQEMLNEQLAQASAILAVMDYTQLKSVSDEEVRLAIQRFSKSTPLTILVNKFDQKDRNSDDASQVKAMVAGTLMKGTISADRVFPVSSMWGYLANRTRYELDKKGYLPPVETHSWVQDFAEEALGRRWRNEDLADANIIRQAADLLWQDSKLGPPIENILHTAHANAAQYALLSACNKLINYAEDTQDYLEFRSRGLQVKDDDLQQQISFLEQDILLLQNTRQKLDLAIQQKITEALAMINNRIEHIGSQLHDAMNDYFREGLLADISSSMLSKQLSDFAAGSERITVDNEAVARTLLLKIRASTEILLFSALETITAELNASLINLEVVLTKCFHQEIKPIEKRICDDLAEVGIRTQITLPSLQTNQLHSNTHHIFTNAIEYQQVFPQQEGIRGMVARWLSGNEWYSENGLSAQTIYHIDLKSLNQQLHQHITDYLAHICHIINSQINTSVTESLAQFITGFSHSLEAIGNNLGQSLVARQQSETVQLSLKNQFKQFIRTVHYIHQDTRLLRKDLRMLSSAEKS